MTILKKNRGVLVRLFIQCLFVLFFIYTVQSISSPVYALPSTTFTVTNTNSEGAGSLQDVIKSVNELMDDEKHIAFNIPDNDPRFANNVWTIPIHATESAILNNHVIIDGFTQPGSHANQTPHVPGQEIRIVIQITDGSWDIMGNNNVVKGVSVVTSADVPSEIPNLEISGDNNTISESFIGMLPSQVCQERRPYTTVKMYGDNSLVNASTVIACGTAYRGGAIEMNGTGNLKDSFINVNARMEALDGEGITVYATSGTVTIENMVIQANTVSALLYSISSDVQPAFHILNNFIGTNYSGERTLNAGGIYISGWYLGWFDTTAIKVLTDVVIQGNVIKNNMPSDPQWCILQAQTEMTPFIELTNALQAEISDNIFSNLCGPVFGIKSFNDPSDVYNAMHMNIVKNIFTNIRGSAMVFYDYNAVFKSKAMILDNEFHNIPMIAIDRSSDFFTPNDEEDLQYPLNYPILTDARMQGDILTLEGFARPGSYVEVYTTTDYGVMDWSWQMTSGYTPGEKLIATFTEGSAQDLDTSTGSYVFPSIDVDWSMYMAYELYGADTTNKFKVNLKLSQPLPTDSLLTMTATLNNDTSEFSPSRRIDVYDPEVILLPTPTIIRPTPTRTPTPNPTSTQSGQGKTPVATNTPNPIKSSPTPKINPTPTSTVYKPSPTLIPIPTSVPKPVNITLPEIKAYYDVDGNFLYSEGMLPDSQIYTPVTTGDNHIYDLKGKTIGKGSSFNLHIYYKQRCWYVVFCGYAEAIKEIPMNDIIWQAYKKNSYVIAQVLTSYVMNSDGEISFKLFAPETISENDEVYFVSFPTGTTTIPIPGKKSIRFELSNILSVSNVVKPVNDADLIGNFEVRLYARRPISTPPLNVGQVELYAFKGGYGGDVSGKFDIGHAWIAIFKDGKLAQTISAWPNIPYNNNSSENKYKVLFPKIETYTSVYFNQFEDVQTTIDYIDNPRKYYNIKYRSYITNNLKNFYSHKDYLLNDKYKNTQELNSVTYQLGTVGEELTWAKNIITQELGYNLKWFNCTSYSTDAWKLITGVWIDPMNGIDGYAMIKGFALKYHLTLYLPEPWNVYNKL
ncbi:MAG: hypothetical protein WCO06_07255 [Candidatus Roizmanbacteria bacterium]